MTQEIITKYQEKITETTQTLHQMEHDYKNGSTNSDWGLITKEFFEKMSLGYKVELSLYKEFISDLEKLNN